MSIYSFTVWFGYLHLAKHKYEKLTKSDNILISTFFKAWISIESSFVSIMLSHPLWVIKTRVLI